MLALLEKFGSDQRGSTAIEYACIAVVVCIAILTATQQMGVTLSEVFTNVGNGFPP